MRKWKAWLFALAVLIGIGTIGTASMKAEAQNLNQGKRVLFISSYSYGWDTVQTQIEGIKAGVDENTTIDYEFMDTKRFRTDEWLNMFHDMLKYHLENTDPTHLSPYPSPENLLTGTFVSLHGRAPDK